MRDRLRKMIASIITSADDTRTFEDVLSEELIAQGVIVPPCKVGDTVYVVSQGAGFSVVWNVYKAVAKAVHLDQYRKLFVRVETDKENVGGYIEIERVFLTREEAEKALERSKNDGT